MLAANLNYCYKLYYFPRAAITGSHKLWGLKTIEMLFSHTFWRQRVRREGNRGIMLPPGSREEPFLAFLDFQRCKQSLVSMRLISAFIFARTVLFCFLSVFCMCGSKSSLSIRTLLIRISTLIQSDLILIWFHMQEPVSK